MFEGLLLEMKSGRSDRKTRSGQGLPAGITHECLRREQRPQAEPSVPRHVRPAGRRALSGAVATAPKGKDAPPRHRISRTNTAETRIKPGGNPGGMRCWQFLRQARRDPADPSAATPIRAFALHRMTPPTTPRSIPMTAAASAKLPSGGTSASPEGARTVSGSAPYGSEGDFPKRRSGSLPRPIGPGVAVATSGLD